MGRVLRYQTTQLWFTEWTCREPALDTMQTRRHQSSGAATNIGEGWILQEKTSLNHDTLVQIQVKPQTMWTPTTFSHISGFRHTHAPL